MTIVPKRSDKTGFRMILRLVWLTVILLCAVPIHAGIGELRQDDPGHIVGVWLTEQEQEQLGPGELDQLSELGITILEVVGRAPRSLLEQADHRQFTLMVRQQRYFTTAHELREMSRTYYEADLEWIRYYTDLRPELISGFGIFQYPHEITPESLRLLSSYARQLSESADLHHHLYYQSGYADFDLLPDGFSFKTVHLSNEIPETLYSPVAQFYSTESIREDLSRLNDLIEVKLRKDQSILLLPYGWLSEIVELYPDIGRVLRAYSVNEELLFPMPALPEEQPDLNWPVLWLILLIGSWLLHYRSNPTYRRNLFRYFTSHNYFADSLINSYQRTGGSAAILFFQHLALLALAFHIFISSALSPTGLTALEYHTSAYQVGYSGIFGLMISVLLLALLLKILSITWLNLISRKTRFSQVFTLYNWFLQLNLPIVILMMGVYHAGGSQIWIYLLSILYLTVWFFSFNLTALDVARNLPKRRILYLFLTIGLNAVFLIFILAATLFYPPISEKIHLILTLTS